MKQQTVWNTAGLIGAGMVAGQAQGVMVQLPQLDQVLQVTGDGTPGLPVFNSVTIDLLPSDPFSSNLSVKLTLDGDLLSEDSKNFSSFGLSMMVSKLVELNPNPGLGNSTILSLLGGGDIASLPLNSGSTAITTALSQLTPGQKKFVVFGFQNGIGETLHGYFGVSYERVEELNGDVTAKLTLSDFAYDDDPNATSLQVVPEPASLAMLAAGMLLAGGRRRSA